MSTELNKREWPQVQPWMLLIAWVLVAGLLAFAGAVGGGVAQLIWASLVVGLAAMCYRSGRYNGIALMLDERAAEDEEREAEDYHLAGG